MRLLAPLIALLLVAAVGYVVYATAVGAGRGRRLQLRTRARWQTRHYAQDGETVVVVALTLPTGEVLDEHVVARIPDQDPDWNARFLLAREEAEERAFHLNATEEPPPT
jgi:pyridoxamine 5'-phosphate oxidase family protein